MKFNYLNGAQGRGTSGQLLEKKLLVAAYNGEPNAARNLLAFWAMLKIQELPISPDLDRAVTLLHLGTIAHGEPPWKLGRKKSAAYLAKVRYIQVRYAQLIEEGIARQDALEIMAGEYSRDIRSIERDISTTTVRDAFEPDLLVEELQSLLPGTGPRGLAVNSAVWAFVTRVNDTK